MTRRWCWRWGTLRARWPRPAWLALLLLLAACAGSGPPPGTASAKAGPDDRHLLAVLVAGDSSITAFDDATTYLRDELERYGVPADQVHVLTARQDRPPDMQPAKLQSAIAQLDALKPAAHVGSCLVYLTSHGAPDQGFYLDDDDSLMPPILDRALTTGCGDAPTVVIVSACYSGQFAAAPMLRPNRIILTAAAADRSSFGCEAGNTFTFFDECLLGALPGAPDWRTVFDRAKGCVAVRERQINARPSEPQGYFGDAVGHLRAPLAALPDPERVADDFDPSPLRYSPDLVPLPSTERRRLGGELDAYARAAAPKAMALTPSGLMVWTSGAALDTEDPDEVARLALERCEFLSGGACILYAQDDRITDLLPSGLAPMHPEVLLRSGFVRPSTVPFIRPDQRKLIADYLKMPTPKALAVSPSATVLGIGRGQTLDAAQGEAIAKCESNGDDCVLYADDDRIVLGWDE